MKEYSVFDKKGGFTFKVKQYKNRFAVQFQQFDFGTGDNNKRNSIKLDSVECSDIADQINANLKTYPQWNQISIYHKYKTDQGQEVASTLNISTWKPDGSDKVIIIVSSKNGDRQLSTSTNVKTIRFIAKLLNHFAMEALETIEDKNYNRNNYGNQTQLRPNPQNRNEAYYGQ